MDKKRHVLQDSIAHAEDELLSVFERTDFKPSSEDMIEADDIVRKWTDRTFHEYRHHTFHYPSMSLYSGFWKRINRKDGLRI